MAETHDNDGLFDDLEDEVVENQEFDTELLPFIPEDDDGQLPPKPVDPSLPDLADFDHEDDTPEGKTETPTLVEQLLTSKGIVGTTIQYENEEGDIEEVDFYTLPVEEQLAILQSNDPTPDLGLEENEIQTINFLRQNGVTFEEAREYFRKEAIQEYIDSQNIAGIEVDQYSDEELYAIDMKAKYDDLTDEDIKIEIEKQLEHPELFKKKIDKLRTDYKQIEQEQREAVKLQELQEQETKSKELEVNLITVAQSVEDIGGLDLDNNDKNEVLGFILDKDINGVSPFLKALDSPKQLFELAWFATKGKEAFDIIHDYYRKKIDEVNKSAYKKGKEEATGKSKPVQPVQERKQHRRMPGSPATKTEYPDLDTILRNQLKD